VSRFALLFALAVLSALWAVAAVLLSPWWWVLAGVALASSHSGPNAT
jgi:hypothetical protein